MVGSITTEYSILLILDIEKLLGWWPFVDFACSKSLLLGLKRISERIYIDLVSNFIEVKLFYDNFKSKKAIILKPSTHIQKLVQLPFRQTISSIL